jgi:hypothetical protein
LGNGGISYHKCGRTIEKAICGYDIIWIKKIAKEPEND